jgi:hypothetical protein
VEESWRWEQLSQNIGNVVIGVDIGKVNVGVVNTFMDIMTLSIDVFSACVEVWVFCKGEGRLVICKERGRVRLHEIDFGSKHTKPHAFASSFSTSNIFGVTGRLRNCFLFACGPRNYTGAKGKTVGTN